MEEFCMPDYNGGSIVNLMSSISHKFRAHSIYPELRILPSNKITSKNVILLIIDGLGYEYLTKNHQESLLNNHTLGSMTSVFPPTTSSAITTFLTGVSTQQHALTGWFMNFKELGVVSCALPFTPRYGNEAISRSNININSVIDAKPLSSKLKAKCFIIQPNDLTHSDYSLYMSKNAKIAGYKNLKDMFNQIKKAVKGKGKAKYIYSYWNVLDNIGHEHGISSKKAKRHLKEIGKELSKFIKSIKGTDTTLILTGDHGHMESPRESVVDLNKHPKLNECISIPMCGEKRLAYCYVHPSKAMQFEDYVNYHLSKYCYLFKGEDLISKGIFGLFEPHPKLFDRIGDYVLITKNNYTFDYPPVGENKKKEAHIGHHAGISKEEMLVPLIVIKC